MYCNHSGISFSCKIFLKGSKLYVFAKESNRTICMSKIEKCHSCHLHTKSLMPPSNFLYALCREKLFFWIENVHAFVLLIGILFRIFKTCAETQIKSMNFVYCVTTFSNNESKVLIRVGFFLSYRNEDCQVEYNAQ